jgi:predicted transcriptional regulator
VLKSKGEGQVRRIAGLRLDVETDHLLTRLAAEMLTSRSHIIRLAIRDMAKRTLKKEPREPP